jgi:hypothetical protein
MILVVAACSNSADEKGVATKAALTIVPVSATASSSAETNLPTLAYDGNIATMWNAGVPAPSWIQFDLGQVLTISRVRINPAQNLSGPTVHEISGGEKPDNLTLIGTLDGVTNDSQWLEVIKPASNIRYIRISTRKSPSWVAWREVEFYK